MKKNEMISDQAQKIFDLFGGARRLMAAMRTVGYERDASCIYRWGYTKARGGTGGVIPQKDMQAVLRAAEARKIKIPAALLNPFAVKTKEEFFA